MILPSLKDPAYLSLVVLIIRKTAHFTEYFILGYLYTKAVNQNKVPSLLLVGCFIPILDETLQLFSPGRAASPVDMAIDLAGYLSALFIFGSIPALFGLFKKNRIEK